MDLLDQLPPPTPSGRSIGRRRRFAIAASMLVTAGLMTTSLTGASADTPTGGAVGNFIPATASESRDVLVTSTHIYWTNLNTGTVSRANLDGTGIIDIATGSSGPSGLATDGTFLYWTTGGLNDTPGTGGITKANLDGTGQTSLMTGGDKPIGLTVSGSFIYWTNFNSATIGRGSLTGPFAANQSFIGAAAVGTQPYGLEANGTHLYWTNLSGTAVRRAPLSGSPVTDIVASGANQPTGVALDNTYVYWANYGNGTIGRAQLDGSSATQTYVTSTPANGQATATVVGLAVNSTHLHWTNFDGKKIGRTAFDTTAPTIIGPSSFSVVATALPMPVTYPVAVSASDVDDASITATCNVGTLTGHSFAVGATTVTCNASDPSGNAATPKVFTVTVTLPPPPVLTLSANIIVAAAGPTGAIVTYAAPTSTTGTPTCSPASGTLFPTGVTTVGCSATDTLGQTTNGSFTVTVSDPGSPVLTVPATQTAIATGTNGAAVNFALPTATSGTVTCDRASGSVFPIGTTTVRCSATNSFGTGVASFLVIVSRPGAPTVIVPSNILTGTASESGMAVAYPQATASAGTPTCTPASGSNFAIGTTTVTCTATDVFGQTGTASFTIRVDKLIAFIPVVPVNPSAPGTGVGSTTTATVPVTAAPPTTAASATTTTTTPATAPTVAATTTAPATTTTTTKPAVAATAAPADTAAVATPVLGDPSFTG